MNKPNPWRAWLNRYLSGIKGSSYRIDDRIPTGYLLRLILSRGFMKIRGALRVFGGLPCRSIPFVGCHVRIKARKMFRAGRHLSIGNRCLIDALSTDGIRLGDNVSIGRHTIIECTGNIQHLGKGFKVGDNVGLGANNFYGCAGGIEIGDDTIVGNFVSFHAENHNYADPDRPIRLQGVHHQGIRIGRDCWIGAKATILDGAVLGDGCIIAAGAVVRAGVYEPYGIYGGVPAKLIKHRNA